MKKGIRDILLLFSLSLVVCQCSTGGSGDPTTPDLPPQPTKVPIHISTTLTSRATETAFEYGDKIGLYVVNRAANGAAMPLLSTGNQVDNQAFTYNGTWTSSTPTYWKDEQTHADFYLYYPYTPTITHVEAMPFAVKEDQSKTENYKASDLLLGQTLDVAPTTQNVMINAKHAMSQMVIKLEPGKGFTGDELAETVTSVSINGIKTQAQVNLATAQIAATGNASTITPLKDNDRYLAVIVPQQVSEGDLITVNVDGQAYHLTKAFTFVAGKQHLFTVTINKGSHGMNVNITPWENDGTDNGGTAE